ncbi:MAG: DUF5681 domain-containing protein [Candidatus Paceibacterota bacterium]
MIPVMGNIKTLKPFQPGPDPRRNTKGRPRGSRNVRTVIMEMLKEKVRFNGKLTRKDIVIVRQLVRKAANGNLKAADIVMDRVDGKPENHDIEKREHGYVVQSEEEWEEYIKMFKRKNVPKSRPDPGTSIT